MDSLVLFSVTAVLSRAFCKYKNVDSTSDVDYEGSCHCNAVKFKVRSKAHLVVWDCNCSICLMKKNWHFIVPEKNFELISGLDSLTEYKFNTKVARHMFCKICGVQAFYRPRSNPDGYAVTFACISKDQVKSYEIVKFEGETWEQFIGESGIQKFSKA